ncbi:MAG TPA: phosphoenolpyruvate synthase, partial [Candidatus Krumholzibacteria bacterium]|nr:phosphoenolpyruvate synthase [Candidatus Krumholzibacteria bacterium]
MTTWTRWFEDLSSDDVGSVGGKNANLGDMIQSLKSEGIRVPGGFATTAEAYRAFLDANDLDDRLTDELSELEEDGSNLAEVGAACRRLVGEAEFPDDMRTAIRDAYRELGERYETDDLDVAVRSSATAEDLPEASFAGQQETYLNVSGEDAVLAATRDCIASLFTDRAISYRQENGFDHMKVALSVGVQTMVHSDRAGSGVMFSIDTESGFPDVVVIDAAWGLGETVVQGSVNPDEYRVFKPLLDVEGLRPIIGKDLGTKKSKMVYADDGDEPTKTVETDEDERSSFVLDDDEILTLGRWAATIEKHYDRPMDMEWARDGDSGELFVLQARPETVRSTAEPATLKHYSLQERGEVLITGTAIGQGIAAGAVRRIDDVDEIDRVEDGDVLVTEMTDPDWVPAMRRASAVVTDSGGRTCHAAIVSRELGIPAVVGTGDATGTLEDDSEVTVSCAEGDEGMVYEGRLDFEETNIDLDDVPDTRTEIMMNIASPVAASRWWSLPCKGIGLARMEFVVNNTIQIHPMALIHTDRVEDDDERERIEWMTRGYDDRSEYFVEHLAREIGGIAATRYPDPVILRTSDFKTNEYAQLIGGQHFEPDENNPMLGVRGASRYYSDRYREGFALECRAIRRVREEMGFRNLVVMIPFCRTVDEAERVLGVMAEHGLERGREDLQVYVMAEIPSNVILAERFAEHFDGFSIGTNDLTQLLLGVDRDSAELSHVYDERNEAVRVQIRELIEKAHEAGCKVGICGQAPSDHPGFAEFLVECGID